MKPIQLISIDSNKKFIVNQDAIKWLQSTNQEKHIAIATVVGKYRTGKSYILNRVLLNQNNGFEVGPTVNACTKGLWIWPELIQSPNDPTIQYMVMDTQGLGSLEGKGQHEDTNIFLIAMLLSSYFIYNSQGSIDEKALQSLNFIIQLTKLLQKGGDKEMRNIMSCFPSFLWLVRDFALRLEDNMGRPITPQQYLENALKLQTGSSQKVNQKNRIRKEMTNYFQDRDCFMLIRPVDDEAKLQNMAKVKDHQLRPKFLELIGQLRSKILGSMKKKMFKGKPCSPAMFVELCQHFCTSINQGGLPEIQSNWDLVCRAQSSRIEKRCLQDFRKLLKVYENRKSTEVDLKKFEGQANELLVKILKYFDRNALGEKVEKKKAMKETMIEEYQKLKKKIATSKNQALDELMNNVNQDVYSMINQNVISSIFEIGEKYDEIIDKESRGASDQTLYYLYKKCYEGIKTNCFTLFGNVIQSQRHQTGLLQQKLGFYQESLNRVQDDHSKKIQELDVRERQLRQHIYQQQIKAKEALEELQRAKMELHQLSLKKNSENRHQTPSPINTTY